jgi:RimJ/RimL family protein N-acetyltransferase
VHEGTTRESGWVRGQFVDELWMSALAPEWLSAGS